MGYRGKLAEQAKARELRASGMTLVDIATELAVSKSSVSLWVRDVEFTPGPRRRARPRQPNALERRKQAEIEELLEDGRRRIGQLSEREFLVAGAALYAGEGNKGDGSVGMANTNPQILAFFVAWLRAFFPVDERRLRVRLYLHEGLDLDRAEQYWSQLLAIPREQFRKAYRAEADPTLRHAKHEMGCPSVTYACSRTHRGVMGLVASLLSYGADPG